MATERNAPSSIGKIGLVLSGGGVRAAVFHLGVLRLLADCRALEQVSILSTVSGGSLVTAAVMSAGSMRWPSSALYLERIFPELRQLLTTRDLFSLRALGWCGVARHRSHVLRHRAEILTDLLDRQWNIKANLSDLPETPTWWINTTCIETGKNWRFSKREMGDWRFGRHYEPHFALARAVAASAAVPYAIGALRFDLPNAGWYRTDPASRKPLEAASPSLAAVNLWDGGAYENLGLEPVYKSDRGLVDCDFLICSDASGPLAMASPTPLVANLLNGRLATPRLFSIASDQIRALRSRMLIGAITRGEVQGVLVRMGNSNRNLDLKADRFASPSDYDAFSSEDDVESVANYPTDLNAVTPESFDRISRHGYEVAERTLSIYQASRFSGSLS